MIGIRRFGLSFPVEKDEYTTEQMVIKIAETLDIVQEYVKDFYGKIPESVVWTIHFSQPIYPSGRRRLTVETLITEDD